MSLSLDSLLLTVGECEVTTGDNLVVTDLPFVTLRTGSQIVPSWDCTIDEFYKRLIKQAATFVNTDFETRANLRFRNTAVLGCSKPIRWNEKVLETATGVKRGFEIVNNGKAKTKVNISSVQTYWDADRTIYIEDIDGTQLGTIAVVGGDKLTTTQVNTSFTGERLYVYVTHDFDAYVPYNLSGKKGEIGSLESDNAIFGINYTIECDMSQYLLDIAPRLKMPLLFKFGMLLHQQTQVSDRENNTIATFKNEDIYEYYESEYNNYLNAIVQGYDAPCDDCFQSRSAINYRATLP